MKQREQCLPEGRIVNRAEEYLKKVSTYKYMYFKSQENPKQGDLKW